MKRLIAPAQAAEGLRPRHPRVPSRQNRKVLAYLRRYEDETVLCVSNLARTLQPVEIDLSRVQGQTPVEMFGRPSSRGRRPAVLPDARALRFYWFRLQQSPAPIAARFAPETAPSPDPLPVLFMGAAWDSLLDGHVRTLIQREALAPFFARQRWFGGKARRIRTARFWIGASCGAAAGRCFSRSWR